MDTSNNKKRSYTPGIAFILVGVMVLLHETFDIGFTWLLPVALMTFGAVLILNSLQNNKKTKS